AYRKKDPPANPGAAGRPSRLFGPKTNLPAFSRLVLDPDLNTVETAVEVRYPASDGAVFNPLPIPMGQVVLKVLTEPAVNHAALVSLARSFAVVQGAAT